MVYSLALTGFEGSLVLCCDALSEVYFSLTDYFGLILVLWIAIMVDWPTIFLNYGWLMVNRVALSGYGVVIMADTPARTEYSFGKGRSFGVIMTDWSCSRVYGTIGTCGTLGNKLLMNWCGLLASMLQCNSSVDTCGSEGHVVGTPTMDKVTCGSGLQAF